MCAKHALVVIVGVSKEQYPGEKRVALVPMDVPRLLKGKCEVLVERGAGLASGYRDEEYHDKGATFVDGRTELLSRSDLVALVRTAGADPDGMQHDINAGIKGKALFGFADPLGNPTDSEKLAQAGATLFAVELIPRITRAQSMDALSSMANIAGYRSVLLAATALPKMFPMMMTAAGTLKPAKVFVLGAGVAGLQAIATAKRLGAVVQAYDVRPEVRDQVQSVGGNFVELALETEDAGDSGGYAKAQSDDFIKRQQNELATYIRANDVIITTAAIPGRKAPLLITEEMMQGMHPGSVVVDLAAETGGNCAVTKVGETIEHEGVMVIGPANIPSDVAFHASQMYSRNVATFIAHITDDDGSLTIDTDDEITAGALVSQDSRVVNERVQAALGGSSS